MKEGGHTIGGCIWLCKDTNLKANHNNSSMWRWRLAGVYDSAKILIWKQITTLVYRNHIDNRCIWLCKDTNLKANHNRRATFRTWRWGVYDSAKILIWKQITTLRRHERLPRRCIWLCKDTNLKANHNRREWITSIRVVYMTLQRY